jgi:hypothetical protein
MINIIVSDNFKNNDLDQLLSLNDTKINEYILNFGTLFYNNQNILFNSNTNDIHLKIKNDFEDKIKRLESEIIQLQHEKTLDITSLIDKGKQITKDEYEKIIDLHKSMNGELKINYDNQINDLNYKNENLNKTIMNLQNNIQTLNNRLIEFSNNQTNNNYNDINSNISVLNTKFSNYFDKIFKGNTEKGIFGENFIQTFLVDKFTNSKILDTHKESAKGDFLFSFDRLKTLVESKNVQTLKKDDTDKFYRDIELRVAKNEINSAILISLNDTSLINGKRNFHFEIKNNIPIIMIGNVFNNTEFIRFAIMTLNYLVKFGFSNNQTNDDKLQYIITSINDIFENIRRQITYLNYDKQIIVKLEESFKKRHNDLLNIDKVIKDILSKNPELSLNDNTMSGESGVGGNGNNISLFDDSLNNIIAKVKDKLIEDPGFNISIKNLETLNISASMIKKHGGIKKISDSCKNFDLNETYESSTISL